MMDGPAVVTCCRCGEPKSADQFAWKRKERGQRNSYCRSCQKAYGREHYLANKARYIAQSQERKRQIRLERTKMLVKFFATNPCGDCGETDPVVLEFDHLRDKSFDVGGRLIQHAWDTVLAEIEKCEVVCANCHRRRTARRRGTVRVMLQEAESERAAGIEPVSFSLEG